MLITSKDNSRVKEMRKLLNSKYSKEKIRDNLNIPLDFQK